MDRLAKIDDERLILRMRADFEKTMREVASAVNAAADGHLIDGSEERCREALGEFRRRAYETALQMRVEATESDPSFSPGGSRLGASRAGKPDGGQWLRRSEVEPPPLRGPGGWNPGSGGRLDRRGAAKRLVGGAGDVLPDRDRLSVVPKGGGESGAHRAIAAQR